MSGTISAIVPTHNQGASLPEVVHSILSQTRRVREILIVDHGSTDETAEMAAQLQAIIENAADPSALPALYYEALPKRGTAGAINHMLSKVDGEYVWICRAPHRALDHTIETLAAELDAHDECIMVAGSYRRLQMRGQKSRELAPEFWPKREQVSPLRHLLEHAFIPLESMMMRSSRLTDVGLFREDIRHHCAYDMQIRIACAGPIKIIEDPVSLQKMDDAQERQAQKPLLGMTAQDARAVIKPFRERIPLSVYEGMFRAEDPKVARRAALLQRGCVMARATDWSLAVRDFTDAAKLAPGYRLSPLEKEICDRALAGPFGCRDALNSTIRTTLRDVANKSAAGSSIARALAGGMARHSASAMAAGRLSEVAAIGKFVSALRIYTGGHGRGDRPGPIHENEHLPEQVYRIV